MLKTVRAVAVLTAAVLTAAMLNACGRGGADGRESSAARSADSASQSASTSSQPVSSAAQPVSSAPQPSSSVSVPAASSGAPVTAKFADPENDPMYVQAYKEYMAEQYDGAMSLCDKAIAKDADCFWAYNIKGIALYFANGNPDAQKALTLIDRSLAINPDYAYGYFNEALINKGLKQFDTSISCFNRDLELKPDDQWAYFGIATIYADTDKLDKCLELLKKSIDIDPSVKETAKTESHFLKYRENAQFKALVQ